MHPLRSQGGDGRKVRGEHLRPFVFPETSGVPSPVLGLGSGRGPGHMLQEWLLAPDPLASDS